MMRAVVLALALTLVLGVATAEVAFDPDAGCSKGIRINQKLHDMLNPATMWPKSIWNVMGQHL